jgi:hypothetical protein
MFIHRFFDHAILTTEQMCNYDVRERQTGINGLLGAKQVDMVSGSQLYSANTTSRPYDFSFINIFSIWSLDF